MTPNQAKSLTPGTRVRYISPASPNDGDEGVVTDIGHSSVNIAWDYGDVRNYTFPHIHPIHVLP